MRPRRPGRRAGRPGRRRGGADGVQAPGAAGRQGQPAHAGDRPPLPTAPSRLAPRAVTAGRLLVVGTPIGNLGDLTPRAADALRTADLVVARGHAAGRAAARPRRGAHADAVLQRAQRRRPPSRTAGTVGRRGDAGADDRCGHARRLGPRRRAGCRSARGRRRGGSRARAGGGHCGRCPVRRGGARVRVRRLPAVAAGIGARAGARPAAGGRSIRRAAAGAVRGAAPHGDAPGGAARAGAQRYSVAAARELTKRHEEVLVGTPAEVASRLGSPRGEFTVVVSGLPARGIGGRRSRCRRRWSEAGRREGLSDRSLVALLRAIGLKPPRRVPASSKPIGPSKAPVSRR